MNKHVIRFGVVAVLLIFVAYMVSIHTKAESGYSYNAMA